MQVYIFQNWPYNLPSPIGFQHAQMENGFQKGLKISVTAQKAPTVAPAEGSKLAESVAPCDSDGVLE